MNHSFRSFGLGDLLEHVNLQQLPGQNGGQGSQVARSRIGFVEGGFNGKKEFRSTFSVEAWNEQAARLAAIPPGHTVLFEGKVQNYSYDNQQGQKVWATKIVLHSVADCGPTRYTWQAQGQPQQRQAAPQGGGYPNGGYSPNGGGGGGNGGYNQPQGRQPGFNGFPTNQNTQPGQQQHTNGGGSPAPNAGSPTNPFEGSTGAPAVGFGPGEQAPF